MKESITHTNLCDFQLIVSIQRPFVGIKSGIFVAKTHADFISGRLASDLPLSGRLQPCKAPCLKSSPKLLHSGLSAQLGSKDHGQFNSPDGGTPLFPKSDLQAPEYPVTDSDF